jgi:LysR family transcriptional regulator, benzoate and cis,cis-muconate-responsive activator of ben and cat genes
MLPMFDLRALKYFVAAYEEGSVTAAARRCFIAQPSISTAIQNLEHALGVRLFERAKNGLTPTADGQRLYPRAKGLLADSAAIVQGFRSAPQREIRLHIQDDMPVRRAGPLIDAIYRQVPGVRLKITQQDDAFDLKLMSADYKRENEWAQWLWEEDYVALIPESHPLRFKPHLVLADLDQVPFIERPYCALNELFAQVLARQRIKPDIVASAVREEAVLGLVELGVGIAVVPESHSDGLQNVITRPLQHDSGLKRRVGLACLATDLDMVGLIQSLAEGLASQTAATSIVTHRRSS